MEGPLDSHAGGTFSAFAFAAASFFAAAAAAASALALAAASFLAAASTVDLLLDFGSVGNENLASALAPDGAFAPAAGFF